MGLASLILGIIGILICITLILSPLGVIITLIGFILGIVDIVKKDKTGEKKGTTIAGIVINSIFFFILLIESAFILVGLGIAIFNQAYDETDYGIRNSIQSDYDDYYSNYNYDDYYNYYNEILNNYLNTPTTTPNTTNQKYEIYGHSFSGSDGSYLDLKISGNFYYYRDKDDLTNNYYEGTYELYQGEDAIEYITTKLGKYGVTEQEIKDLFRRNSSTMSEDNFYCMILNNETCIVDGENTLSEPVTTPYYGFYFESQEKLQLVNMNAASYAYFTRE